MIVHVIVQPTAEEDLLAAYRHAAKLAPLSAARWLSRFRDALQTLCQNPARCPLAEEDRKFDLELRELHFGKYPNVFRILFTIGKDAVYVLRIRRAQRRPLTKKELEAALSQEEEDEHSLPLD